uniref:Uncharacterized protein n=1 Tax=Pseudomonas phage HRDY3 TaxID=3236930 RepID=A0AB39CDS3_9VIRU
MEMMLAVAENRNPVSVDKLPKGSKVTHYEVRKENTLSLLGRGNATTARQAVKQLDRILPLGSKAVLSIFANDGDRVVLMRETYVMTRAGVEKA